ncbi:FAD-dependent oxidoreductase [Pseudomonadales bacterium]|mgnify:FL=1|jgi:dihydrolipoamide dehydrogenase|nr:FAD-dependent oxidoreductase [Pseudomonadales bacterium]MDA7771655.1 FAD-dependent oxidoreductase [Pseudomonadales bacterium]MDA7833706.1 FAD-dependent oxidoreductase [Pseudomonadales bacterium]|tara:strand:+ start:765 stop:2906 length:2142 start_codon:yes stop_codon:yes gene_type:complete
MSLSRFIIIIVVLGIIGSFFAFDFGDYLTLAYVKSQQAALNEMVATQPLEIAAAFFFIYIAVTAASLPGAAILTLVAGAMFGVWWGTLLVSFASSIGATLAMLVARFILREQVEARFGAQLSGIDKGIEKEGAFYLFTLRLVPLFPFFAINLLMGLTKIKVLTFFIVSQIGMLAGTLVYVNAGTQLAEIESTADILSVELLLSFALLGIFPLIAKKIVDIVRDGKNLRKWSKPKSFDQNVIVIGAGSGGLVAALIVATVKGKVTLIERHKMGGDCLNTGCVPSKSLIRSAKLAADITRSRSLGFKPMIADFEFADVMERVQQIIKKIEPHDSVERFESLGVNCEIGEAKILSPYSVEINGKVITAKNIIVATGAQPLVPGIKNIESVEYLTSDTIWEIREQPKRLVVLGGGPIGTELSQAFHRLGSEVTQIEAFDRIMSREDPEFSHMVMDSMKAEGVEILTGHTATEVVIENGDKFLRIESVENRESQLIPFDQLLVAIGRKANVTGFGLEDLGISLTDRGTIEVDEYLRTNYPNIYAIGDVAGPYQFTHTASHMAWYAAVNSLFGTFKKFKVDYSVVPWATFCSPEVARVGLNETEANAQGISYEVVTYDVGELDRALADEEGHGLVKVLTVPGKDKILGVTIAADHAGDLISEYVLAMKHGLGLRKIMGTIHIYPTLAEMNKFAASEWAKQHKPEGLLGFAEKFHAWRRG